MAVAVLKFNFLLWLGGRFYSWITWFLLSSNQPHFINTFDQPFVLDFQC